MNNSLQLASILVALAFFALLLFCFLFLLVGLEIRMLHLKEAGTFFLNSVKREEGHDILGEAQGEG